MNISSNSNNQSNPEMMMQTQANTNAPINNASTNNRVNQIENNSGTFASQAIQNTFSKNIFVEKNNILIYK